MAHAQVILRPSLVCVQRDMAFACIGLYASSTAPLPTTRMSGFLFLQTESLLTPAPTSVQATPERPQSLLAHTRFGVGAMEDHRVFLSLLINMREGEA
jgi:hypothetical protein